MALLVQKYGGTSVGNLDRIKKVADQVIRTRAEGHDVVVVLSAIGGETDRLIGLADAIHAHHDPREYAVLVSTGEQVSIALLSMELIARGCPARSFTGKQAGFVTNSQHKKARILDIRIQAIQAALSDGHVAVVAGFQGVDEAGDITTLGRGGSDTSAVALAASLKVDECQIYTDVDGVYTTDPRVVPSAKRLDRITFEEMLELSSLGAKVLQIRAVEFAGKFNVPLRVLSSFRDGVGTLITYEDETMEQPLVSGIAFNRNEAKITVVGLQDKPGVAAGILGPISEHNIDVDMIVQNIAKEGRIDFSFTIHRDDYQKTLALLDEIISNLEAEKVVSDNKIAKISLVGVGMRSHAGIANTMFTTLGGEGINIQLITTSEIKVSVVVDEKYLELGVRALHTAFGLDGQPTEEFDPKTPES